MPKDGKKTQVEGKNWLGEKQIKHIEIATQKKKETESHRKTNNCNGTLLEMWMEIPFCFFICTIFIVFSPFF